MREFYDSDQRCHFRAAQTHNQVHERERKNICAGYRLVLEMVLRLINTSEILYFRADDKYT